MDLFELTRALVDIESVTNDEANIGEFLIRHLSPLAAKYGGHVERMVVEAQRFNVFASWGHPIVTLSTHMDTVPPFFPLSEDDEFFWGRGACDAKGIIAAMISTVEQLLAEGISNLGLLFVVGEERNSAGARIAAKTPRGSRYLINGWRTASWPIRVIRSWGAPQSMRCWTCSRISGISLYLPIHCLEKAH